MASLLLVLGTTILLLLSLFLILLVLLQRGGTSGGLGTAFGGDAMSSAFGTETGNFLSKATVWGLVLFFVLSFGLYLGFMAREGARPGTVPSLRELAPVEAAAPAASGATTVVPAPVEAAPAEATAPAAEAPAEAPAAATESTPTPTP